MAANDVATLVTDAMPYVTAAGAAYGGTVLAKTRDKAADATVGAGVRILQRVFGRKKDGEPLPEPLASVVANPGDQEFLAVLKVAMRKALEWDAAMLAEVRGRRRWNWSMSRPGKRAARPGIRQSSGPLPHQARFRLPRKRNQGTDQEIS